MANGCHVFQRGQEVAVIAASPVGADHPQLSKCFQLLNVPLHRPHAHAEDMSEGLEARKGVAKAGIVSKGQLFEEGEGETTGLTCLDGWVYHSLAPVTSRLRCMA